MNCDQKVIIKLVRANEIRIVHQIPANWAQFQETLKIMYGTTEFHITYVDDEGDSITVAGDLDLVEALRYGSEKPSLKLVLKPISIAQDFEELKIEERPESVPMASEIPSNQIQEDPNSYCWRGRGRWGWHGGHGGRGGFFHKMKKMKKYFKHAKNKMIKMKVIYKNFPKKWMLKAGSIEVISWTVINKGKLAWPQGSYIMDLEGDIKLVENVSLSEVKPGEIINLSICVTIPSTTGKHHGRWALMVGNECAGVLKSKIIVITE